MEYKVSKHLNISPQKFWKCMEIWITKPQTYQKDCGCCDVFVCKTKEGLLDIIKQSKTYSELKDCLKLENIPQDVFETTHKFQILIRFIYRKQTAFSLDNIDIIECNLIENALLFINVNKTSKISFSSNQICYESTDKNDNHTKLFTKMEVWSNIELIKEQVHSLKLVSGEKYTNLYNTLKRKYMEPIFKIWTESTNPKKYIPQAIAIATYLLLIWNGEKQNFVDLGCGAGLLVHILNSEGQNGIGIDVRSRKIWSNYPSSTILQERTIRPSDDNLFPEADWIIGNHSDELTPWIPVIAAKSSYKTNFFLLPCCPYTFEGKKYARNNAQSSQYADYMNYIEFVIDKCGFSSKRDRLRIASTKRICFVSHKRIYNVNKYEEQKYLINQFIGISKTEGDWIDDFKPRESQKVRNCTQIDKNVVNEIIKIVANFILETKTEMDWNEGEFIKLETVIKRISPELKMFLKCEHGGLQTLLRNHRYIFEVEKGSVRFRKPIERSTKPDKWKQQTCWFYKNHPNSCPLENENCSYIHN